MVFKNTKVYFRETKNKNAFSKMFMIFIKSSKYFKIIYIYGNDKNYSKKRLTCIFYSPENTKFVINNTDVLLLGQTNRL